MTASATTNYWKDGEDVVFFQFSFEAGVPEVCHEHTNFLSVYVETVNHIADSGTFWVVSELFHEPVVPKVGKEFDLDFH